MDIHNQLFIQVLLEQEQRELLELLVEASRNVPREERGKFMVFQTMQGDILAHSGLKGNRDRIYLGDVEALAREQLVALRYNRKDTPQFDVTPLGFKYYEYLKNQAGEPAQTVEETVHSYVDSNSFRKKYPLAYQRWSDAESRLWSTDSEKELTTIGHLCREAMQEFAHALIEIHELDDIESDKAKTVARIRTIFTQKGKELGSTEKPFLDALLVYWGTISDLVMRQEHGSQKEGTPLVWEDARRIVFQTLNVMYEIDKAL